MSDPATSSPARGLAVEGTLTATLNGDTVTLRGEADRVVVEVESVDALRRLARAAQDIDAARPRIDPAGGGKVAQARRGLNDAAALLDHTGLTADLRVGGKPAVELGHAAVSGMFEKLLKLKNVDVKARSLIGGLLKG